MRAKQGNAGIMKTISQRPLTEETLDPEDWKKLAALGHRMLDDMLTYLENIRSQPTLPPPKEAIDEICVSLSQEGKGEEKVYEVFKRSILPYTLILTSPRFWGD